MPGLVLSADARPLRRSLGPTAWVVLEELAFDAQGRRVVANVRGLAAVTGLDKDTVARALGRLIAAGIVTRQPQPVDRRGRFAVTGYELRLPAGLRVQGPTRASDRRAGGDRTQLSLLDDPDHLSTEPHTALRASSTTAPNPTRP